MPSILHLRQNLRKDIARFCRTILNWKAILEPRAQ